MFEALVDSSVLLIGRTPGAIVGPIAKFLGVIYNGLFEFIYNVFPGGSLGLAIILFTLLVKLVLFPLMIKQQKSSFKMQQLQPEMNKIRQKYKDKKDQASQQKMAYEIQEFQKKNGISMVGGCLPLLVQLPILYALFYIFQQAYMYVDVVANNYTEIANVIINIPTQVRMEVFQPYAQAFVDANKMSNFDMNMTKDVVMLVNDLKIADWTNIVAQLGESGKNLVPLLATKSQIESFIGIPLVYKAGLGFPGIIVPILAAVTTWFQSKLTMSSNAASKDGSDPAVAMTRSMMYVMPAMMGFMTITMPAGLGLYWIISNIFTIGQQILLNKFFKKKFAKEAEVDGRN